MKSESRVSMGGNGHAHLSVAADLVSIRAIGPWLRELLAGHEGLVGGLELALQELAVNIIEHGYAATETGATDELLVISGEVTAVDVTIRMVDTAMPFPGAIATQAGRSAPGEVRVGGFGLTIIEQVTDEFVHNRIADGNEWTLVCGFA